jgi:DNA ligase D-like protein (predicted polymerase)
MLIRKNTKAFKSIAEILNGAQLRPNREKLIRLYVTRAGSTVKDRISVEAIEGNSTAFYEMNYQSILNSLKSPDHQLHQSDDFPGIYFFRSASNKVWDETPFEFDETVKNEFGDLPDFPVVRKKEKLQKFVLPTSPAKGQPQRIKKQKDGVAKTIAIRAKQPSQPDYKLKHKIEFTNLEKIVIRQPRMSKGEVLNYYSTIASYILPYLEDRPVSIRMHSENSRRAEYENLSALMEKHVDVPEWIERKSLPKHEDLGGMLLCNDKEHLLYYVEQEAIEFKAMTARVKSIQSPDYFLITIDSPESSLEKVIPIAMSCKTVLSGLKLPSFVKTNGTSGLHVYVPLDAKSNYQSCRRVAENICKLIRIRVPDLVSLEGSDNTGFGKVSLSYLVNDELTSVVAPYSLVYGESATVATPLLWEEVNEDLQPDQFNHETIFKRLKAVGDPFKSLFSKKINADALLARLEADYAFLF